ncbi:hypothetical protein K438DRAFT_1960600 [Mycena galopus ATCC 62051]|nr:hypothetical protein K438DRAFT_1960600 [Mycena galopus ATCC 62051]
MGSFEGFAAALLLVLLWLPDALSIVITAPPGSVTISMGADVTITWTYTESDPQEFFIFVSNETLMDHPVLNGVVLTSNEVILASMPSDVSPGPYNMSFQTVDTADRLLASILINLVGPSSSSEISNSATSNNLSGSVPAQSHSNVGTIAGSVVAGTSAILLAFLGGWYVRRWRGSAQQRSSVDLTLDPPNYSVETIALLNFIGSDRETPRSSVVSSTPVGASNTPITPLILRSEPLQGEFAKVVRSSPFSEVPAASKRTPTELRWDPPTAPSLAELEETRHSRDELEDEVRMLREHIGAISPPPY